MTSKDRDANPETNRSGDEYMRGGKGRKDEVRGSGIYPASSANAPADAETRTVGELVHHEGPRHKPKFKRSI